MKHLKYFKYSKAPKALDKAYLKETPQEINPAIYESMNSETVINAITKTKGATCPFSTHVVSIKL